MTDAPAGDELLAQLRRPDVERLHRIDGLVADIRAHLESAVVDQLPLPAPIRLTKDTVRRVLRCERHLIAHLGADHAQPTAAMIAGAMADRLFAQAVVGFAFNDDPVLDALRAAEAEGDNNLLDTWAALPTDEQNDIRTHLRLITDGLSVRWPRLPSSARPRLQHSMRVELCDGRVILSGRVDLALGEPKDGRCGTVLIDAKSGKPRTDDREDAAWYALLETLRSGCQPFQSGNYYLASGALDVQPITIDDLRRAGDRTAEALNRVSRIASGAHPTATPGPLCPWCPVHSTCDEGSEIQLVESDSSWLDGFEDDDETGYLSDD